MICNIEEENVFYFFLRNADDFVCDSFRCHEDDLPNVEFFLEEK